MVNGLFHDSADYFTTSLFAKCVEKYSSVDTISRRRTIYRHGSSEPDYPLMVSHLGTSK